MRTMVLSAVSGKAAASRAVRRVQDAGRKSVTRCSVSQVGLHQPPVAGIR